MNLPLAIRVLHSLRRRQASASSGQRMANRLAARWLQAGIDEEMDILFRLAMLEGAAGVPEGTWWKKGRRGLTLAAASLDDLGATLNPAWLSPKYSGVTAIVRATADRAIRSWKLTGKVESDDILQSVLAGISTATGEPLGEKKVYFVGKSFRDKILNGKESPREIATGFLSKVTAHAVELVARNLGYYHGKEPGTGRGIVEGPMPMDEEGRELEFTRDDAGLDDGEFGILLNDLVFHNLRDPVSARIRNLMRASWAASKPMTIWLDIVENERRFPMGKEVAELAGIAPSAFTARHWKPYWRKFFQDLWSRPGLINRIADHFQAQGYDWEPRRPSDAEMDILLKPRSDRPRLASGDLLFSLLEWPR